MTTRQRADRLLVARGLFESRARAQAAIAAGRVTADGVTVRKASDAISSAAFIEAQPEHPYVSRGGVKLAAALDHFRIDVAGRICLDVGASTGGFTEVLVLRNARRVYAIDVGRHQLHPRLRKRGKIVSMEQTDIGIALATADRDVIGKLLQSRASMVALIKPQFEAPRRAIKKGIVRDAAIREAVCADIAGFLIAQGWRAGGRIPSPILGADGNAEFFVEAKRG